MANAVGTTGWVRGALCAAFLAMIAILAGLAGPASAARAPSAQEKSAIWKVVLGDCRRLASGCRRGGILVSVADPRFAYAQTRAKGPFKGALVKRGGPSSRTWRIQMTLDKSVESCADWRRHAPLAVLKDMGIEGIEPGEGSASPCWSVRCGAPARNPKGTQGIYFLHSKLVGCEATRKLVSQYHAIRQQSGLEHLQIGAFECKGSPTLNYEGLVVECRGGKGVTVNWTAQLAY